MRLEINLGELAVKCPPLPELKTGAFDEVLEMLANTSAEYVACQKKHAAIVDAIHKR